MGYKLRQDAISAHVAAKKMTGNSPAVRARQRIEQTIVLAVVKALLDAGYSLGVDDGEEITIHRSRDAKAIEAALFTTDEDFLLVYDKENTGKDKRGDWWVRFTYGNDGWDVMSDYCVALDSVIGDGTDIEKLIETFASY
jgi:hypothetical protein